MFIQTESTPNPATLKFLPGRVVLEGSPREFLTPEQATASPLAAALFEIAGLKLPAVDQRQSQAIRQRGAEFLHEIQRQRGAARAVSVEKAALRIETAAFAGAADVGEEDQRRGLARILDDGLVGDPRNEAERAFGADHQVREDVEGVFEVDKGV